MITEEQLKKVMLLKSEREDFVKYNNILTERWYIVKLVTAIGSNNIPHDFALSDDERDIVSAALHKYYEDNIARLDKEIAKYIGGK